MGLAGEDVAGVAVDVELAGLGADLDVAEEAVVCPDADATGVAGEPDGAEAADGEDGAAACAFSVDEAVSGGDLDAGGAPPRGAGGFCGAVAAALLGEGLEVGDGEHVDGAL